MDRYIKLLAGGLVLKVKDKPAILMRPQSGVFPAPESMAARLVKKGKAVYVDEAEPTTPVKNHEPDLPAEDNGEIDLDDMSWGDMTRAELNDLARQYGVEHPEEMPNKGTVIDAINRAAHEAL